MQICLNINPDAILEQLEPLELTNYIKSHDKKFDILEAFSREELLNYMINTGIINDEEVAKLVVFNQLNLEHILGKVAYSKFIANNIGSTDKKEKDSLKLDN